MRSQHLADCDGVYDSYQARAGNDLRATLLNHTATTAKMVDFFQEDVDFLASRYPSLPLVLSEGGSSLAGKNRRRPDLKLSGSLGSAVWTVDWLLFAMTMVGNPVQASPSLVTSSAS